MVNCTRCLKKTNSRAYFKGKRVCSICYRKLRDTKRVTLNQTWLDFILKKQNEVKQ